MLNITSGSSAARKLWRLYTPSYIFAAENSRLGANRKLKSSALVPVLLDSHHLGPVSVRVNSID